MPSVPEETPANTLHREARQALRHNDFRTAAARFAALAGSDPRQIDAMLRAAHCFEKLGEQDAALNWYLKAAESYLDAGYDEQALATLRLCKELSPDSNQKFFTILDKCERIYPGDPGKLEAMLLSDKQRAARQLRFGELFSSLSGDKWLEVFNDLEFVELADGELLCRQGDPGDSLYFVVSGKLLAIRHDRENGQERERLLDDSNPGDIAGEGAYFGNGLRTADLRASGHSELLRLGFNDLNRIAQVRPSLRQRLEEIYRERILARQLFAQPLFAGFDYAELHRLARSMRSIRLGTGVDVVRQGEPGLDLYYIRSGDLAIVVKANMREHLLKVLQTGQLVGETAMVNQGVRTATVRTISPAELMMLPGEEFEHLVHVHPELLERLRAVRSSHLLDAEALLHRVAHGGDIRHQIGAPLPSGASE